VETMLGRRRYVPDIKASNPNARNAAERIAMNTPIQGTSADMIKLAMLRIDKRIREEGLRARMILQVHDELIFDAPEDEVDRVRALAVEEMQAALPLKVPIDVDVKSEE
jgi:DNA polymerase-1